MSSADRCGTEERSRYLPSRWASAGSAAGSAACSAEGSSAAGSAAGSAGGSAEGSDGAARLAGFRSYGNSKDHREDLPQVVVGMAVTRTGIPVRVRCWPGNTADAVLI